MTSGSQGQVQVLSLIDSAIGAPLLEPNTRERDLKAQLETLFQNIRDAARLKVELDEARQEEVEIESQHQAREDVKEDATLNQLSLVAGRYLQRMQDADSILDEAIKQVLSDMAKP